MNALIAMAKRPSLVLNAMAQESGLWDFISATAKNARERESALVLSAAGQVLADDAAWSRARKSR
jgi:hypothetical protein